MAATSNVAQGPGLQIHELTSSATDEDVRRIMDVSAQIFAHVPADPDTHTSFDFWRGRLERPHANMYYATRSANPDHQPVGFFFNFPTTQKEFGYDNLHIWLAGVLEEARNLGIFPMLLERTVAHGRAHGYRYLTVGTLPATFPRMYQLLQAHGWETVSHRDSDKSVLMSLKL